MVWQVVLKRGVNSASIIKTLQNQSRNFHVTKIVQNDTKVGLVGMGHVGNAVCHNLLRKGKVLLNSRFHH